MWIYHCFLYNYLFSLFNVMMFLIKMTQVRLTLIVAAFLTLTGNFTFLEKTILVYPLSENWLFVGSLLVWLFVFLSALLLLLCYRHTIKPILINWERHLLSCIKTAFFCSSVVFKNVKFSVKVKNDEKIKIKTDLCWFKKNIIALKKLKRQL